MAAAQERQPGTRQIATPSALQLLLTFSQIGVTSFGGGLSGWMLREFVQRRAWLTEEEFLSGLALSQAFPGVNTVNLAIWVGYRLQGNAGALAGVFGMIVPAAMLILAIAAAFAALSGYRLTHLVLDGVGAAAVGLSLQMGIVAARRAAAKGMAPIVIMIAAFVAVGVLRLSLPLVVLVLGSLSVALAFRDLRRA